MVSLPLPLVLLSFLPDKGLKKKQAATFFTLLVCGVHIHKGKPWKNGHRLVFFWQMVYFPNKSIFFQMPKIQQMSMEKRHLRKF